ncbi:MAG: hypothetical protein C4326_00450 [Ignavibacteria bacterium]
MTGSFKQCSYCGVLWKTKDEFLADRSVRLEGYQWQTQQVIAGLPANGVLVFTHATPRCGTSLTISAKRFQRNPK